MIDKLLITKKLSELKNNLKVLYELRETPFGELSDSVKNQWTIFYGLQVSIQIIIDIGNHILASIGENQIEDYVDIIEKLGKRGVIPENFANKIRNMPGLRNILVHKYGVINIKKIYDILQNNLSDFEDFILYITEFLKKEKP
jgi:uncharacterized protein YutE (UPF0331/DUF86 family)